jgi:hypothetical protein
MNSFPTSSRKSQKRHYNRILEFDFPGIAKRYRDFLLIVTKLCFYRQFGYKIVRDFRKINRWLNKSFAFWRKKSNSKSEKAEKPLFFCAIRTTMPGVV